MNHDNDNGPVRYGPWPTTRKDAERLGTKHYFTGEPCMYGHLALRLTSNSACMICHNDRCGNYNKMKRQLDDEWREEMNRKQRLRYHANPAASREHNKRWAANNPDRRRIYGREYLRKLRDADPTLNAKTAELMREKRSNPEYARAERARERARYAESPEKYREKSKRYAKENPERAATHARNRRSIKRCAEGYHSESDVISILERQGYRCAECKKSIKAKYHVDHIIPLSKGGSNWPSNIQGLCATCNLQKNNLDPLEFAKRKGRLL